MIRKVQSHGYASIETKIPNEESLSISKRKSSDDFDHEISINFDHNQKNEENKHEGNSAPFLNNHFL